MYFILYEEDCRKMRQEEPIPEIPWGGRVCCFCWPVALGLEWRVLGHPANSACYTWAHREGGSVSNIQRAGTIHSQAVIPKK